MTEDNDARAEVTFASLLHGLGTSSERSVREDTDVARSAERTTHTDTFENRPESPSDEHLVPTVPLEQKLEEETAAYETGGAENLG